MIVVVCGVVDTWYADVVVVGGTLIDEVVSGSINVVDMCVVGRVVVC